MRKRFSDRGDSASSASNTRVAALEFARRTSSRQIKVGLTTFGVVVSAIAIASGLDVLAILALMLIVLPLVHGELMKDIVHGPFGPYD